MPAPTAPTNNPATHGKEGIVGIKVGAGTMTAIGNVSDWTLDMSTDKVETTALGDGNKKYVIGLKDVSGSFTAFWDKLDDAIFEAAEASGGCVIGIWPAGAGSPQGWEGPAWLDASIKGGATSAITIDATFVANGTWTRTPPAAALAASEGAAKATA